MRDLGFTPCRSYENLWMRVTIDTSDLEATTNDVLHVSDLYYEYIFIHVDDFMVTNRRAEK